MDRTIRTGCRTALILLVTSLVSAAESEVVPQAVPALDLDALAQKAEAIIGVVLEHHIDPPTRQEMWLRGIRALLESAAVAPPPDLSARISRVTEPEQFRELLHAVWDQASAAINQERVPAGLSEAFIYGLLHVHVAPSENEMALLPGSEKNAVEQIGANRYVGTGIALRYEEGFSIMAKVFPGGPVARAGGKDGDRIFEINGEDARGFRVERMVERLRGEEGTQVTLQVRAAEPDSQARTLLVTRGPVRFEPIEGARMTTERGWDYRVDPKLPIRYIKFKQLNGSAVHELRKLDQQFIAEQVRGVILDFRTADASDAHQAVLLADALLDGGQIGRLRTRSTVEEIQADRDCLFRDMRIAVLLDQYTEMLAEWVALALHDLRGAIGIGQSPDAGWPLVWSFVAVPGASEFLRLPTAILERPADPGRAESVDFNVLRPSDFGARRPGTRRSTSKRELVDGVANSSDATAGEAVRALQKWIETGQGPKEQL